TADKMQVALDKPVQFKQSKDNQSAKVNRIVCDAKDKLLVEILEEERDKSGKLVLYRRMLLPTVDVNNLEQRLEGSGPGTLDFIGQSNGNETGLAPANNAANAAKKPDETAPKHTRIRFNGQMISRATSGGGRTTDFY